MTLNHFITNKFPWRLLMVFITLISCSDNLDRLEALPMEIDDTNARFVIDGTPWTFHRYELLEIRERNGSLLSEEELEAQISDDFSDVVIEFNENGTGAEVGFDPIPSSFFWELNSAGNVVFLDQVGNEFSPLGNFKTDIPRDEISFTFEFPFLDSASGIQIVVYGTTFLRNRP